MYTSNAKSDLNNELTHYKYIKREKKKGKWHYTYSSDISDGNKKKHKNYYDVDRRESAGKKP